MRQEVKKEPFEEKYGKRPTRYYLDSFNQITLPVPGEFINDSWKEFSPLEQRFISHLSASYVDWKRYINQTVGHRKNTSPATRLQSHVCSRDMNFDSFIKWLLEDLSEQVEPDEEFIMITDKESPDYGKMLITGYEQTELEAGIDLLKSGMKPLYAGTFEASCYFFALAFHYLREDDDRKFEYDNAMLEASELLGEFRGWYTAAYELEIKERDQKNKKSGGDSKAEKEFGAHRREVLRILEEMLVQNEPFEKKSVLIKEISSRLDLYVKENNLKGADLTKSKDTSDMIKNWSYRNKDIKKAFEEVMSRKQ